MFRGVDPVATWWGGAKTWSIGVARGCSGEKFLGLNSGGGGVSAPPRARVTPSRWARTGILGVVLGGILHSVYDDD